MKKISYILLLILLTGCNKTEKYLDLAYQAEKEENYQLANEYLDKVLKINPNHLIALNNRGWNKFDLGDTIGALNDFEKMILSDSTCDRGFYNRGEIFIYQKKYNEALYDLNYVAKLINADDYIRIEWNENSPFLKKSKKDIEKPITNLDRLLLSRGYVNLHLDNYEKAYEDFTRCIYHNADCVADALYYRAFCTENAEAACEDLQRAAFKGFKVGREEYDMICSQK